MSIDVTQALKDTENCLRDFISSTLSQALGVDWKAQCGVSQDRLVKWEERKNAETKRQVTGVVEERLIYYADFYDLKVILKKHWDKFSPALGELKIIEVYLGELEKLRDPDAHRRELLPHQKQLAAGIAGEIRTRLVRYRSKLETAEDCFPRIESARDNLGNIWVPQGKTISCCKTKAVLRPGDQLDFVVTASDPMGDDLLYALHHNLAEPKVWQNGNAFALKLAKEHIRAPLRIYLLIKSKRDYHADNGFDAMVIFSYVVLPLK